MNATAEKRYLVEWTPWADVKAAAEKRGMPADGEASDYVLIENYDRAETFPTFPDALAFAKSVIDADTWHCPRIRRQVLVQNDHDDLGNRVRPMPAFQTEATWEVMEDIAPDEASPDWLDEAA